MTKQHTTIRISRGLLQGINLLSAYTHEEKEELLFRALLIEAQELGLEDIFLETIKPKKKLEEKNTI